MSLDQSFTGDFILSEVDENGTYTHVARGFQGSRISRAYGGVRETKDIHKVLSCDFAHGGFVLHLYVSEKDTISHHLTA